jgi:multiple sugar transport system substrate-binding protein
MAGCRPAGNGSTVTFWALGAEGENIQGLIEAFEREHPGVKVNVQSIPWTAAHEKLLTAYAGNSLPDIFQLGNTWIPEFALLHALEDLDGWIGRSQVVRAENYFPGIWQTNIIDSVVYGIPWYVDTRLLFYRKDVFSEAGYDHPPRDWEEWYDLSKNIKRLPGGEQHYAILLPTNEWTPFVITGLQAGSTLLKDGNRYGDFSGPGFRSAFAFLMKFYREGLAPSGVTQVSNVYQAIEERFVAMYITGPWNIAEFRRRLPPQLQDRWMTAPLPGRTGAAPGVSLAGGSSLVVSRTSERKAEAWQLVEFLSRPAQQLEFSRVTGDLPAVRGAWNDTVFTNNIYVRAFYEQLEHVVPTPTIPEWEQIAMKIQQYAEEASIGRVSIDEALTALDRDVNTILEKRRWMMERTHD